MKQLHFNNDIPNIHLHYTELYSFKNTLFQDDILFFIQSRFAFQFGYRLLALKNNDFVQSIQLGRTYDIS